MGRVARRVHEQVTPAPAHVRVGAHVGAGSQGCAPALAPVPRLRVGGAGLCVALSGRAWRELLLWRLLGSPPSWLCHLSSFSFRVYFCPRVFFFSNLVSAQHLALAVVCITVSPAAVGVWLGAKRGPHLGDAWRLLPAEGAGPLCAACCRSNVLVFWETS